jgi:hypothetical protein
MGILAHLVRGLRKTHSCSAHSRCHNGTRKDTPFNLARELNTTCRMSLPTPLVSQICASITSRVLSGLAHAQRAHLPVGNNFNNFRLPMSGRTHSNLSAMQARTQIGCKDQALENRGFHCFSFTRPLLQKIGNVLFGTALWNVNSKPWSPKPKGFCGVSSRPI